MKPSSSRSSGLLWLVGIALSCVTLSAQSGDLILDRDGTTVVLEPYAPNIIRVTMSTLKDQATAGPGYGVVAKPAEEGWTRETGAAEDTFKSARMTVSVAVSPPPAGGPTAPSSAVRGRITEDPAVNRSSRSRMRMASRC